MIYVLLAVLTGLSIIFSRILNANLALRVGLYQGTFINYVVGFSGSLLLLIVLPVGLRLPAGIPLWAFWGGFLGVLVLALSSYITHRVSNFNLTLLIFIGQLLTGVAIDLFMGNSISATKILGGIIICLGLAINIYVDGREKAAENYG